MLCVVVLLVLFCSSFCVVVIVDITVRFVADVVLLSCCFVGIVAVFFSVCRSCGCFCCCFSCYIGLLFLILLLIFLFVVGVMNESNLQRGVWERLKGKREQRRRRIPAR